jgi:hypothetical protein
MKIKLLTSMAGVDFSHDCGDQIEVNDATAIRYIEAGIAEAVREAVVEKATIRSKVEKAVKGK